MMKAMAKNIIRSNLQKKTTLHVEAFFSVHLPLFYMTTKGHFQFQKLPSYPFYGGNVICVLFAFFFTATHFHLGSH